MNIQQIAGSLGKGKEIKTADGWLTCCPVHDDETPSLSIKSDGNGGVLVNCHAGCDWKAVKDNLKARGLINSSQKNNLPAFIWNESVSNDPAIKEYLSNRNINTDYIPKCLRLNKYKDQTMIVAEVRKPGDSEPVAIHRTYLDNDHMKTGRKMLGKCGSRAVWLSDPAEKMLIGEGIETVLAAMVATGLPGVACLSVAGMKKMMIPDQVKEIIILVDSDPNHAGQDAAQALAERFPGKVQFATPNDTCFTDNPNKLDFNDLDPDQIRERLEQVVEFEKQKRKVIEKQGDFVLKPDGLYLAKVDDEGVETLCFICSRIEVVAKVRNENSEGWGRLLRFHDSSGVKHEWALPMRMLAGDATELRANLLDLGLHIVPGKARNSLGTYIQIWKVEKFLTAVERTGWYHGSFILPEQIIGENSDEIVFQTEIIKKRTFGQAGTVEDWRDNVAVLCVGNSRLIFSVSAAFASPLLELVNEDGGGAHWSGRSSEGKTTLLRTACSVCGPWKDYKLTWKTTDNGLEGVAESRNDSLLILDELAEIDSRLAGKVAYMLANGQGKQRANKLGSARGVKRWRLLFLSTGEVSLADHMSESGGKVKAGQEVRMVDIPADAGGGDGCFENLHGFSDGSVFSDEIVNVTCQYYGTPFIRFLENIRDTGIEELAAYVKGEMGAAASTLCPPGSEGQVKRVAKRFALIGIAGELASEITGWEEGAAMAAAQQCFNDWITARGGPRNKEVELTKKKLISFIEQHGQSRFQDLGSTAHATVINRAGFFEVTDGVNDYFILPSSMQEIFKGENLERATEILAAEGLLKAGSDGKRSIRKTFPGLGRNRCYHVPGNAVTGGQQ